MEIREVTPAEFEPAGEVAVEGYREFYGDDLGSYAERIRDVPSRASAATVLIALDGEEIVGTVTYVGEASSPYAEDMRDDEAAVRMLAVAPAHKRKGIGRALSLACIDRAREAGKRALVLHADEIMPASRALYEALGFQRDPARDFEPDEQTRLVCYVLGL